MGKRKQIAIGDIYNANGVKCKVINIYNNTFAVRSERGTGVVRLKDRKLVGSLSRGDDKSDRRSKYWN